MFAGFLGIVALGLVLFVTGALMERNYSKAAKFGAALAGCAALILLVGSPRPITMADDCYIDWDIRVSRTVCD